MQTPTDLPKKSTSKTISILGAGWLGEPLAQKLATDHAVKASTTTLEKFFVFKAHNIEPFLIELHGYIIQGEITDFLKSEILIIAVPPKIRSEGESFYYDSMEKLIPLIEESTIEHVILVSSTSVYASTNETVDETTETNPDSKSGEVMVKTENLFQQASFDTTIVRFGGLFNEERHPGRFLSGKKDLKNGDARINLIHQEDAIGLIMAIIDRNCRNEIINGVTDGHPKKREYYPKVARVLGVEPPEYLHDTDANWKVVSNSKAKNLLHYRFKHQL